MDTLSALLYAHLHGFSTFTIHLYGPSIDEHLACFPQYPLMPQSLCQSTDNPLSCLLPSPSRHGYCNYCDHSWTIQMGHLACFPLVKYLWMPQSCTVSINVPSLDGHFASPLCLTVTEGRGMQKFMDGP